MPEPLDLRLFMRSVGKFFREGDKEFNELERPEAEVAVEMIDTTAAKLDGKALAVTAFVDGIQNAMTICWIEHRPVTLAYIAAGGFAQVGQPIGMLEALEVVCSKLDAEWVSLRDECPSIVVLDQTMPIDVGTATTQHISEHRARLERKLVRQILAQHPGVVCVDGSVVGHEVDKRVVGIIKTVQHKWLPDESILFGLPAGWRSPRFKIPQSKSGPARYSCYVRLHEANDRRWDHGLVRLESFGLKHLEPLGVRCLRERQVQVSGDGRWDRHLHVIAGVEKYLRARRPGIFSIR